VAEYSIYETKAKLSEVLRQVKARREVVITERGKPIAKIVPYEEEETQEQRIARLIASGHIIPAAAKPGEPLPPPGPKVPGALKRFLADRGE
jgi:prevent-host-death family protein